jgi:hypothetical protein
MEVQIKQLDVLPMVKHYMNELKVYRFFDKYLDSAKFSAEQVVPVL